jgi:tight adherence protein C
MSPDWTLPLLLVGVFLATAALTWLVTAPGETPALRLARYTAWDGALADEPAPPLPSARDRLLQPFMARLLALVARRTPRGTLSSTEADLIMAGSQMRPAAYIALRSVVMVALPIVVGLLLMAAQPPSSWTLLQWAILLAAVFWGRRLPTMLLKRRIRARQREIDRNLPYTIDLMVACLEGGLSLDAALVKVMEQSSGPLAYEVRRTLQEMALGRPPAEAIKDLGDRTGAPGLKRLTEDIVQSERLGVSIADSMRNLARDTRILRRQQAEEAARKAPIKMVPVLIFCVLPALGIVTVAPAGILIMRALTSTGR